MRVRVASTGGGVGTGAAGLARARRSRYSSTDNTTQPSGAGVCARAAVEANAHTISASTTGCRTRRVRAMGASPIRAARSWHAIATHLIGHALQAFGRIVREGSRAETGTYPHDHMVVIHVDAAQVQKRVGLIAPLRRI